MIFKISCSLDISNLSKDVYFEITCYKNKIANSFKVIKE